MTTQGHTAGLTELAERVEKLTGPCRETDGAIKLAFAAQLFAAGVTKDDAVRILGGDLYAEPLPYTGSLDAAMTLVPGGWDYCLSVGAGEPVQVGMSPAGKVVEVQADAPTPALAMTAASLRARASMEADNG